MADDNPETQMPEQDPQETAREEPVQEEPAQEESAPEESAPAVQDVPEEAPKVVVPKIERPSDPKELKELLDKLNEKKEAAFQKKQQASARIAEKINLVQEHKKSRNGLTRQVRELKKQRDDLNTQITARIEEIKASRPKVEKPIVLPVDAKGRRIGPQMMHKRIAELEQKIETIPMDFNAEQKVMKEIKTLRKQLDQIQAASGLSGDLAEKSKEIDALKKDANALHAQVTEMAKQSQEFHERMLNLGKEIDELKATEDRAYQEFLAYKQQYVELAGDLNEVRDQERADRQAQKDQQVKARKKKEAEDKKTLQQRAKEAEDKMFKGEKLTTEDLLALQSVRN